MRRQHTTPNAYPAHLLDAQLRALRRGPAGALGAAALHLRSFDARALLARAAGADTVDELLAAAHGQTGGHPAVTRLDPYALGELARVVALQQLRVDDRADALALLDLLLGAFGPTRVAPAHQGLHCQLGYALGHRERARQLLDRYRAVPRTIRAALRVDLANPYAGGTATPDEWLHAFQTLLPAPALGLRTGPGELFDRVDADPAKLVGDPARITTIVTTYEPGPALVTTVRSLVAQTWTNHEILIIDDGSPAAHDPVLHEAVALDPRVRLIRMDVNGGTYVARNAGLGAATGDFVTFADSDDWSHPLRLERQVRPLLDDPALVATTSVGMRVTENLVVTRVGVEQTRSYNLSSLMIRRRAALQRLGYLDVVRKGADAEYVERARAVFGRPAVRHLTGAPLALIRLSGTSLSSADIRPGWMHPARHAYLSAFQAWHRGILDGLPARRPARPSSRVFAAPRRLSGATDAITGYDVLLAGDWTAAGDGAPAAGRARALTARGLRVALLHLDTLARLGDGPQPLDDTVQALINAGTVDQVVLTDDVPAELLIVATPEVLYFAPELDSRVRAARVVVEIGSALGGHPAALVAPVVRRLFGTDPRFAPPGPVAREALDAAPDKPPLAEVDLPGTVDIEAWRLDRRGPRSDRPVVGRLCGDGRAEWRRLRELLTDSRRLDVRLLKALPGERAATGERTATSPAGPPRHWLVYEPSETTLRSFLFQVDFYLVAPEAAAPRSPDATVLQALAAGCVVVLPHQWAPVFGDAAVYGDATELTPLLRKLHARPDAFGAQSQRGQDFVRQRHGHERFAELVQLLRT